MLMLVHCTQCGISGTFDIELKFRAEEDYCKSCAHDRSDYFTFNFCNLSCLTKWMEDNDASGKGFPCQRCLDHTTGKPSGFMAGFKQNGKCTTCKGTGRCHGNAKLAGSKR